MNKLIIIPLLLLIIPSVFADVCPQKATFMERIQDSCKIQNEICEDGESALMDKDCQITGNNIYCKEGRCIFKEIWFAKVMLVLAIFLLFSKNKDNMVFVAIILLILFYNFSNVFGDGFFQKFDKADNSLNYTDSAINQSITLKYGRAVMPSNPTAGFVILLIILYLIIRHLFKPNIYVGGYKR